MKKIFLIASLLGLFTVYANAQAAPSKTKTPVKTTAKAKQPETNSTAATKPAMHKKHHKKHKKTSTKK